MGGELHTSLQDRPMWISVDYTTDKEIFNRGSNPILEGFDAFWAL
jgi:hypothetical protein